MGALPLMVLVLAQVPVGFRGDRVGQGYLAWGRLATVAFGGVRATLEQLCSEQPRKAHNITRETGCL